MEPYSREDKQLLAAVASQAGVALETIRLGENIGERIEAERRAAQEMEFSLLGAGGERERLTCRTGLSQG